MPRWLIAVFTLHFLLSVSASAFGKTPTAELPFWWSAPAVQVTVEHGDTVFSEQSSPAEAASMELHEHGLTDANQDLPDDQNIRLPLAGPGHTLSPCPAEAAAAPLSPALKKRLRPPRARHLLRA